MVGKNAESTTIAEARTERAAKVAFELRRRQHFLMTVATTRDLERDTQVFVWRANCALIVAAAQPTEEEQEILVEAMAKAMFGRQPALKSTGVPAQTWTWADAQWSGVATYYRELARIALAACLTTMGDAPNG